MDTSDVAADVNPFLKNKAEEASDSQEHLPRVCEERGLLYRDTKTGVRARLMTVRYSPRCNGCDRIIPEGAQALGIRPDAEGNKHKKWVFGCLECANASTYESLRVQGGLFPEREEG